MVTVVEAGILVQAYLDILDLVLAGIQEQAVILDSLEHQATLAFLVILEFQVFRVIQAHLDTQASADTQVHQVIPAQADTQVRLAFQVIQESVDILALVCLATAVRLVIQAYLVSVDIPDLWALVVHKVTGVLFGTPQHKLLL